MKFFDLTTEKGKANALSSMALFGYSPILELVKMAFDKLTSSKEQGEIANELIRKGKENGVKEMEIKLDNTKGLNLDVPIEGVNIKAMVGSDEKVLVKVIYK